MKKTIFISGSATIVILLVMFYFHSVSSNTSNDLLFDGNQNLNQDFNQNGNNQSSFYPQSGGWQLQTMPNMGSRLVRDLYFTDSLTGYAVASPTSVLDSSHILKTTNGGNNWLIKATYVGNLPRITFLNANTGFAGGNFLFKTTNAGENWVVWNWGPDRIIYDMQVFSEDTIWYADRFQIGGGLFRTINGGVNWEKRDSGIPANSYPIYIYFYNSRIGFATGNTNVYKTTDAGLSWNLAFTGGAQKLYFKDSLNGYRASQGFFRTSNGGINWSKDSLPSVLGNYITNKEVWNFYALDNGTIYALRARIQSPITFLYKGIIYKTTNWGENWGYQIPDTSYGNVWYDQAFVIRNSVWAYTTYTNRGIFSSTGGDTTTYVGVNQIEKEVPNEFELYQNYPNPFNNSSKFRIKIANLSNIKVIVYDIQGREVQTLIEEKLKPGVYECSFNGNNLSSGIYFYQLIVDNKIMQTRRVALLK